MSDRVSTHSTPLPILVKDVKKQISEDSTNNSAEKARQLANLDKAYQIVVAELVGSN